MQKIRSLEAQKIALGLYSLAQFSDLFKEDASWVRKNSRHLYSHLYSKDPQIFFIFSSWYPDWESNQQLFSAWDDAQPLIFKLSPNFIF